MINDRQTAIEFDAVCTAYMKLLDRLPTEEAPKDKLQKVYVMFVFDPDREGLEKWQYFKRRNEVEADVIINREEFLWLDPVGRRSLLHTRLLDTLLAIRQDLEGKVKHELDAMISAVSALGNFAPQPTDASAEVPVVGKPSAESVLAPAATVVRSGPDGEKRQEFQLVLQFPEDAFDDEADMFALEECLTEVLADKANVDGNDIGLGKFNIFILTGKPAEVFEFLRPFLERAKLLKVGRVAYADVGDDDYHILWPKGDNAPFEL
ncbi:MAG: hypothetical protein KIS67_23205 [Verrucomicrobiae bacterium]|nr:hypothetical protein [Verrucomicrobiae bacterium]